MDSNDSLVFFHLKMKIFSEKQSLKIKEIYIFTIQKTIINRTFTVWYDNISVDSIDGHVDGEVGK